MTKSATLNGVFALVAAAALVLSLAPAFALADDEGQTNIITANEGSAVTTVVMTASTGGNTALGGDSGNGGHGGSINDSEDGNVGGIGGWSGYGGAGGAITTGAIDMSFFVSNLLNTNEFDVTRGASEDGDVEGDDNITTANAASAVTTAVMDAATGDNYADGGFSGDAGDAGNVNASEDDNLSGDGGDTGAGGDGGFVETGPVSLYQDVVNLINSTLVRVLR